MNKRYIDFVPANKSKVTRNSRRADIHVQMPDTKPTVKRTVSRGAIERKTTVSTPKKAVVVTSKPRVSAGVGAKAQPKSVSSNHYGISSSRVTVTSAPTLGVVEDLNGKFVKTDVPKRPLGDGKKSSVKLKNELEATKSRKLIGRRANKASGEAVSAGVKAKKDNSKYKPPRTPFINQEKVVKRPLSKNVYQKKVVAPKEKPTGPVAIIAKPEKESYVGVVVAVIITIILGAAAGTVAFLLLPK